MSSKWREKVAQDVRERDSAAKRRELYQNKEWYNIRSILGNDWAHWFFLIGARERSVASHLVSKTTA